MNLTKKQHELIDELLEIIRTNFPETRLISLHPSPESDNDIWVNVCVPETTRFLP